ncbi:hypothetical protein [Bradyrhizobium sp. USDA 10063]
MTVELMSDHLTKTLSQVRSELFPLDDPWCPVASSQISVIADANAQQNWSAVIEWRNHLASADTLEAAYLDVVRRSLRFPHIFV